MELPAWMSLLFRVSLSNSSLAFSPNLHNYVGTFFSYLSSSGIVRSFQPGAAGCENQLHAAYYNLDRYLR